MQYTNQLLLQSHLLIRAHIRSVGGVDSSITSDSNPNSTGASVAMVKFLLFSEYFENKKSD